MHCNLSARVEPGSAKCLELTKSGRDCLECSHRPRSVTVSLLPEVMRLLQEKADEDGMTLKEGIEWLLSELCKRYKAERCA